MSSPAAVYALEHFRTKTDKGKRVIKKPGEAGCQVERWLYAN